MQITKNFWLHEFERSSRATRLQIDNRIPNELIPNATRLARMMQDIRDMLTNLAGRDVPITITSGYRSPELNRSTPGSSSTSHHLTAGAADWLAWGFGSPTSIVRVLLPHMKQLGIGQIIDEYPPDGWVHTSIFLPENPGNVALVKDHNGYRTLA
jgi:uncharacterized protein YcbK (DUF882 family)